MSQTEVQLIKDAVIVNADVSNSAAIDVSKISGAMPLAGGTFTDDVTFTGANYNISWDKSDNSLLVNDDARIKFGTGKDYASTPLIDYGKEGAVLQPFRANTGGSIFPRRDGGIMPSEGSGQVDDVPAMLTAGEFVLTKDAVKGLGGGDQNLGIQRAYNMMDSLERMA